MCSYFSVTLMEQTSKKQLRSEGASFGLLFQRDTVRHGGKMWQKQPLHTESREKWAWTVKPGGLPLSRQT